MGNLITGTTTTIGRDQAIGRGRVWTRMRGFRHLNSTSMIGMGLAFPGLLAPPAYAGRVW